MRTSPARQPDTRPAAELVAEGPRVPFRLTVDEEAELDLVLRAWEAKSAKVKSVTCNFTLWMYDVFGGLDKPRQYEGELKYMAPDKGWYLEQGGEHWVCDGQALYEFKDQTKELIEHPLPDDLRGKAISHGPLPFMFSAPAGEMKKRYWIRVLAPPPESKGQLWLEVYPRWLEDAQDFQKVEIILTQRNLLPYAVQIFQLGEGRKVYQFRDISLNNPLQKFIGVFAAPKTPRGWKRIIEEPSVLQDGAGGPPSAGSGDEVRRSIPPAGRR